MRTGDSASDRLELFQRGLAYGDGLFETIRVAAGRIPLLADHEARLKQGMAVLQLQANIPAIRAQLQEQAAQLGEGLLKLILVRRSAGRGYAPATQASCYRLETHPLPAIKDQGQGICAGIGRLRLSCQPRLAGIKHLNRLEQVLAAMEASERNLDELWLCNTQGQLIEGVQSNLFVLTQTGWHTPALEQAGVAGVVRAWVLRQMQREAQTVTHGAFSLTCLDSIQAAFMTSSGQGIMAVAHIDGRALDPHHERILALKQAWNRMLKTGQIPA